MLKVLLKKYLVIYLIFIMLVVLINVIFFPTYFYRSVDSFEKSSKQNLIFLSLSPYIKRIPQWIILFSNLVILPIILNKLKNSSYHIIGLQRYKKNIHRNLFIIFPFVLFNVLIVFFHSTIDLIVNRQYFNLLIQPTIFKIYLHIIYILITIAIAFVITRYTKKTKNMLIIIFLIVFFLLLLPGGGVFIELYSPGWNYLYILRWLLIWNPNTQFNSLLELNDVAILNDLIINSESKYKDILDFNALHLINYENTAGFIRIELIFTLVSLNLITVLSGFYIYKFRLFKRR